MEDIKIIKILFVCSQNQLRSPTAERIFSKYKNLDVKSAGLHDDAEVVISGEYIEWAEYIFVMEDIHKYKLVNKYSEYIKDQKIVCLQIPDKYAYMDEELIKILKRRVAAALF